MLRILVASALAVGVIGSAIAEDKPTTLAALCLQFGVCAATKMPNASPWRLVNGEECPVCADCAPDKKSFCPDKLPHCCISPSGVAYCAKDTTGCTKD